MAKRRHRPLTTSPADHRNNGPAKQIGIRIPPQMNDQLEALARRERNGVSSVIRRLLAAALMDADKVL